VNSSSNGWRRLTRRWRWYVRKRDVLSCVNLLLAGVLAINAYTAHPEITAVVGTLYVISLGAFFFGTFRDRRARDQVQGEVLWGLFSLINKEIFKGDHRTRYTLFLPDSADSQYISPWYRYFKSGRGPINEAEISRARYKRGEGLTGQAWNDAGHALLFQVFPKFETRQKFEDYYINKLKIAEQTVKDLSEYMQDVQTMLCYSFVGDGDRTLGVLSLDLKAPLTLDADGRPSFPSPDDDTPVVLNGTNLRLLLSSVQNVLESFVQSERRLR
jgi:hypothetical protein